MDEAWRSTYDDWKLDTPPEYEEEHSEGCDCPECDPDKAWDEQDQINRENDEY